jgi:hypothetical protein
MVLFTFKWLVFVALDNTTSILSGQESTVIVYFSNYIWRLVENHEQLFESLMTSQ